MQPSVDPGAGGIGEILAGVVSFMPASGPGQPQDPLCRFECGGRMGIVAGGLGEGGGIHGGETTGKANGFRLSLFPS